MNIPHSDHPRVVIVGGGFAGINLAKKLANKPFQVVLLDKNNYHTFQPLLYQVATAGLEPDAILEPLRNMFEGYSNIYFRYAAVEFVEPALNKIVTSIGELTFDYLVFATGSRTIYYDLEGVEENAMSLKSATEALDIRSLLLQNFEKAVTLNEKQDTDRLMDVLVVGGGPSGVEMAGAIAELRRDEFKNDYPELDVARMEIYIVEMAPRLLPGMSEEASDKTKEYLERLGVKVWLDTSLEKYDGRVAHFSNGSTIETSTLIYSAGVGGNFVPGLAEEAMAKGGRLKVNGHLQVNGYDNIFAIGDVAAMITPSHEKPHPMLAQPAIQQGKYMGKYLMSDDKSNFPEFEYNDKGTLATIGKNKAVADLNFMKTQGFFAWLIWIFVHLMQLVGFRNFVLVFVNWALSYVRGGKRFRLIIRNFERKRLVQEKALTKT